MYEKERKFLLSKEDAQKWLDFAKQNNATETDIKQAYMVMSENEQWRVRLKKNSKGEKSATWTFKKNTADALIRFEEEDKIDTLMASRLMENSDYLIYKKRFKIPYKGQSFDFDIFLGENDGTFLLEIELPEGGENIVWPPEMQCGKEVTYDGRYRNENLAKIQGAKDLRIRPKLGRKKLIITHANCTDGSFSRAILEQRYGKEGVYLEVSHDKLSGVENPEGYNEFIESLSKYKDMDVIMSDICLPEDILRKLMDANNSIFILDHHETAKDIITSFKEKLTSEERERIMVSFSDRNTESGAMLTWNYIHPSITPPLVIELVSDSDTWQFKFGESAKFLYAGLAENGKTPQDIPPETYIELLNNEDQIKELIKKGAKLRAKYMEKVHEYAERAKEVQLEGHKGMFVMAPSYLKSELGNLLAQKHNTFGMVAEETNDGMVKVSLRSIDPFRVDDIAAKFNGGGHKQASAFRMKNIHELAAVIGKHNLNIESHNKDEQEPNKKKSRPRINC